VLLHAPLRHTSLVLHTVPSVRDVQFVRFCVMSHFRHPFESTVPFAYQLPPM
jgi:hypothetical protein